jgi:hypothetical protein
VPAKEMLVCFLVELIFRQIGMSRQQTKRFRFHNCGPESDLYANGAITPQCSLAEVDVRLEANGAAVTAPMIGLHYSKLPGACERGISKDCISLLSISQIGARGTQAGRVRWTPRKSMCKKNGYRGSRLFIDQVD